MVDLKPTAAGYKAVEETTIYAYELWDVACGCELTIGRSDGDKDEVFICRCNNHPIECLMHSEESRMMLFSHPNFFTEYIGLIYPNLIK